MSGTYRILLSEWRNNYYQGNKIPSMITLKRRIQSGILPGTTASGDYIVFCDANYNPVKPPEPPVITSTGNALADAILKRTAAPSHAKASP